MTMTATKPTDLDISKDPEVQQARAKMDELQTGRAEARDAMERARELLRAQQAGGTTAADAEALLAGAEAPPSPAQLAQRIRELERNVRAHDKAIEAHQVNVQAAESQASASICEALMPEYRETVGRIHAALTELGDAVEAESAFRRSLQAQGVRTGRLPAIPTPIREWERLAPKMAERLERDHPELQGD